MTTTTQRSESPAIEYPDSDGLPMADNTLQYEWIVTIKGGLDAIFAAEPSVFVAGDLLWYPVKGEPTIRMAPDALVAFGRPKGYAAPTSSWRKGINRPRWYSRCSHRAIGPLNWIANFGFTNNTESTSTTFTTRTTGAGRMGAQWRAAREGPPYGGFYQPAASNSVRARQVRRQLEDFWT